MAVSSNELGTHYESPEVMLSEHYSVRVQVRKRVRVKVKAVLGSGLGSG